MAGRVAAAVLVVLAASVVGCAMAREVLPLLDERAPAWQTRLSDHLACEGEPAGLGAAADPVGGGGSIHAPTAGEALALFVEHEAPIYGFLPIEGWEVIERRRHWVLAGHVVEGRPRALVSFTDEVGAARGEWAEWQVAACDASEFDPDVRPGGGLVVWTDEAGRRVPTTELLEAELCGELRRLVVLGHAFVRDPAGLFPRERLLAGFAADVAVPADAVLMPFHEGDRRLWFSVDRRSAYVGTAERADRWPRVIDDDASVSDCN